MFLGSLNNLSNLNKQYGLSKGSNEAMFVIKAYRTLRDRGPYPAHQVLRDLDGSFGFVLYDSKAGSVFAALASPLQIQALKLLAVKENQIKSRYNNFFLFTFLLCRVLMKRWECFGALQLMGLWSFLINWRWSKEAVPNHLHHFQLVCERAKSYHNWGYIFKRN